MAERIVEVPSFQRQDSAIMLTVSGERRDAPEETLAGKKGTDNGKGRDRTGPKRGSNNTGERVEA